MDLLLTGEDQSQAEQSGWRSSDVNLLLNIMPRKLDFLKSAVD